MDAHALLRSVELFSDLDDDQIGKLASAAGQRTLAAGEKIVEEGDTAGLGFWIVASGQMDIVQGGQKINSAGPGQYFGEMALLSDRGTPRSADVIATEDTVLLQLTRWDFKSLIMSNPDVAVAMLEEMAERLRLHE